MTIRVVLADDQPLMRAGLVMVLSAIPDVAVVGEAGDGVEAVELARRLTPDVVVMDLEMPNLDGVAATRQITADGFGPDDHPIKVLVLTAFSADEMVYDALRAGASGFMLKDGAPNDLVTAVHKVAAGDAYLDPAVTGGVIACLATQPAAQPCADTGLLDRLTTRERQILEQMAYGLSNVEIARTFFLAEATVKTHVCRVIMKLEARDRTQAVVLAYRTGLVKP